MTEKMTYEKLFKALLDGKKVRNTRWESNQFIKFEGGWCIADENRNDYGVYFLDTLLNGEYKKYEIIEEERPYDMTYHEAFMYMLEKPQVHQVSNKDCPSFIYRILYKETLQVEGINKNDGASACGYICLEERNAKWRKEPDLKQDDTDVAQPDTDTNVATKKYKKGDKLLTPGEVFKALLAGERVKKIDYSYNEDLIDELEINPDDFENARWCLSLDEHGIVWFLTYDNEAADFVAVADSAEWDYMSDEYEWWEIAE